MLPIFLGWSSGGQIFDHVAPQVIANQVRVPPVVVQQALHPIGSGVASPLRQLLAVLALHRAEQPLQIIQRPTARLRTPEPSRDALVHPLNALGPLSDFRNLIPHHSLIVPILSAFNPRL